MGRSARSLLLVLVGVLAWVQPCRGQWSGDPGNNLAIADRSGPQVQAKIVARSDGGFYVSWFDDSAGGYDVYLQRLDAAGVELWPHNGVLVADRGYSSTQDYGLAVDTQGNALLAFRDDRGGVGDEVTVARVTADGLASWGASGVQVSGGGDVAMPRIAGTSDGRVVVAWTENGAVRAQKLDSNGAAQWGAGVTLSAPAGAFIVSHLEASDAGSAIVSIVHSPVFMTNHLLAQKLASDDGAPRWGSEPVVVFDAGSLQMGSFPPFVGDGSGGAVFAWYVNSDPTPTYLDVRVQRILANGSEAFIHQGAAVSTNDARQRVGPSAAFLPATQETVVLWTEMDANQTQWGLVGQKLNASGARQWGDSGVEVVPVGGSPIGDIVTLPMCDGGLVAWSEELGPGNEPINAACLGATGASAWPAPTAQLKTSPTGTWRQAGAIGAHGYAAFTWSDGDTSAADVLAQNVNPDGSLGPSWLFADGFETGLTAAWSVTVP